MQRDNFTYSALHLTELHMPYHLFRQGISQMWVKCKMLWFEVQCISDFYVTFQSKTLSHYWYWINICRGHVWKQHKFCQGRTVVCPDFSCELACLLVCLLTSLNSTPREASSTELIKFPIFCVTWTFIAFSQGPPLVPNLSQINPSHALWPCFFKICLNIMLPSVPKPSKWFLSFMVSYENPVCISILSNSVPVSSS